MTTAATAPAPKSISAPAKRSSHIPPELLDGYGRLLSLDFFRGFVMFMLMAEFLWESLEDGYYEGTWVEPVYTQLTHAEWDGLHCWDVIQPFFMFIVGVAMPISFNKRWDRGDSWFSTLLHAFKRSAILLLLGVGLYFHVIEGPNEGERHLAIEFWNTLSQLSFTYLIAFLVMRRSWKFQLAFSIGLLALTELLYRLWAVEGFNRPFTPDENFGAWFDMIVTGHLAYGHWVAINALPTAAHTIWGVLAGQLLISDRPTKKKLLILLVAGVVGIVIGYSLAPVTPIIKRIATSSFTIVSGGWCLLALAFSFWAVDIKKLCPPVARFFAIVGMNPLLIYLFVSLGGAWWLSEAVSRFPEGFLGYTSMPEPLIDLVTNLLVVAVMWYGLYFLYRKKVFVAI